MQFTTLVKLAVLCGIAAALPADLVRKDCSAEITSMNAARRAKRGLTAKSIIPGIPELICTAAPEVDAAMSVYTTPPNRSNVVDGQAGVSMILDIGVVDVSTCQPMVGATVEIWSPNAVGTYGTFLRGATPTGSNGIAEFNTIFPGHTSDGANHVNVLVRPPGSKSVAHVGEVFFTDPWTNILSMYGPYAANTNSRVLNAQDSNFKAATAGGYGAIIDVESIHDDWPEGVSGYITIGVNPKASF